MSGSDNERAQDFLAMMFWFVLVLIIGSLVAEHLFPY